MIREYPGHWFPKFLYGLNGTTAITLGYCIFYAAPDPELTLRVHEHIHVRQIKRDGVLFFYFNYLWQYLKNYLEIRDHHWAYTRIPYEVEAYRGQQDIHRYQRLFPHLKDPIGQSSIKS